MAALPFISVSKVDPQATINNPIRALSGPTITGTITPDGTFYGVYATWLYVGTSGNLTYTKWDGTTQALTNVAAGVWHPIHSLNVTTATASGLVWGG